MRELVTALRNCGPAAEGAAGLLGRGSGARRVSAGPDRPNCYPKAIDRGTYCSYLQHVIPVGLRGPAGPGIPAARRRPRRLTAILLALAAALCLAAAVASWKAARAEQTRPPTAAQKAAAAALAVASRWRSEPAGQLFPATLTYDTSLLTTETARRVAISPIDSCAGALSQDAAALAATSRCQAGLRATYLDQPQGVLFTVGVLAFPTPKLAASFAAGLASPGKGPMPLQALALPGTASALFTAGAEQAATARHAGPYVVLTVSGYADGEPAGAGQEARPGAFTPASQLAATVLAPLTRPVTVNCARPAWSC